MLFLFITSAAFITVRFVLHHIQQPTITISRADVDCDRYRPLASTFVLKPNFDLLAHSINRSTAPIFRVLWCEPPVRSRRGENLGGIACSGGCGLRTRMASP
jgi:hypothetical protein